MDHGNSAGLESFPTVEELAREDDGDNDDGMSKDEGKGALSLDDSKNDKLVAEKTDSAIIGVATSVTTTTSTASVRINDNNDDDNSTTTLESFSDDVIAWVMSYLTVPEISSVSLVSKRLTRAARSNALWKLKFEDRWNIGNVNNNNNNNSSSHHYQSFQLLTLMNGQNWYLAYQEAYHNPHDLWVFHWNCTYPQDGLVPGRCCIYDDVVESADISTNAPKDNEPDQDAWQDLCPSCRFFPEHPLKKFNSLQQQQQQPHFQNLNDKSGPTLPKNPTEAVARATDRTLRDFCQQHNITCPADASNKPDADDANGVEAVKASPYSTPGARRAFAAASTFHRNLDTQQYTVVSPQQRRLLKQDQATLAYTSPLKDLLFFNVTEEPLSTKLGDAELEHLRKERQTQQEWERTTAHIRDRRRRVGGTSTPEFWKPAHETAHHTWHQALIANPDFARPIVFRILVQRPDCFVVFPSEGYLEAGQSAVLTFGVRPLGSLVATAFETIDAQRYDNCEHEWMQKVYDEEGPLPCTPFVVRYKYGSVVPCIPERGFISPHQSLSSTGSTPASGATGEGEETGDDGASTNDNWSFPSVADICWQQKQAIDFQWSGGDTNGSVAAAAASGGGTVEPHEVRSIYLSAHVNAHYPFVQFYNQTLTPFDLSVDPTDKVNSTASPQRQKRKHHGRQSSSPSSSSSHPMLYFAAPQLYEFYRTNVFPQLQAVQFETEVSNAGQVFRSYRKKCVRCRRASWGPRLEEMGQAFVTAQLESWLWRKRQTALLQNCVTIVKAIHKQYREKDGERGRVAVDEGKEAPRENKDLDLPPSRGNAIKNEMQQAILHTPQLLFVALRMLLRYRSASYINNDLRSVLTRYEIVADGLYGLLAAELEQTNYLESERIPWRKPGNYRYQKSTDSVFCPDQTLTNGHDQWEEHVKDEEDDMHVFRHLLQTPGKHNLGPQEDTNHLGELVATGSNPYLRRQKGCATDMFMDDPIQSLQCALITLRDPRTVLVHGIYDQVPYPGKVVRRPRFPPWIRNSHLGCREDKVAPTRRTVYYQLQDTLDLEGMTPPVCQSRFRTFSLRRYLRNIPPLGMGRFPLSIDSPVEASFGKGQKTEDNAKIGIGSSLTDAANGQSATNRVTSRHAEVTICASSQIISLRLPPGPEETSPIARRSEEDMPAVSTSSQSETTRPANQRVVEPLAQNAEIGLNPNIDFGIGGVNIPGDPRPGPRLLNLLWAISAQLGWALDDPGQSTTSVVVNRQLLIALQWLSLTLMATPLFWTLCARSAQWIPCKPVDYNLEDLPYRLTSEMRFLSETECGAVAFALVVFWLLLGRWTERWTSRDFVRAMLEHVSLPPRSTTFVDRILLRYKRQWDSICPLFLQRLTYTPEWNCRSVDDLMNHIAFWRSQDFREHRSVFHATAGRGVMFCSDRWREINVRDESSRKLLFAATAALGSFSSSTPHFWMNLLTVFSCSISLGLSMSLHSLETGSTGTASGNVGAFLKSMNLVTLVMFSFLLGQLLGSSGGVLFLAEFVVTSISFILGGAGTISASSVESWGCFFCLSSTAFWGYLFGRVALMDGIIRQKRLVRSNLFSTCLLCGSLAVVLILWVLLFCWRWDVPVSLMILRPSMVKNARRAGGISAASGSVARSAAAEYAAKHLQ